MERFRGGKQEIIACVAFNALHNGLSNKAQHTTMELCVVVVVVVFQSYRSQRGEVSVGCWLWPKKVGLR